MLLVQVVPACVQVRQRAVLICRIHQALHAHSRTIPHLRLHQ
jgi:hypothetical protein